MRNVFIAVIAAANLSILVSCDSEPKATSNGRPNDGGSVDARPNLATTSQAIQNRYCGNVLGLQSGAVWPMAGGCPTHAAQSSEYGADTNDLNWELDLWADIRSGAVVAADGTIYLGTDDNRLHAIDPETGDSVWSVDVWNDIRSTPAIGADGTIYFGSNANKLHAVNPQTHQQVWSYDTWGDVTASPVVGVDGTIYVGSYTGVFYAINSNGTKKWQFGTSGPIRSSAAIGPDGTIYFGSDDHWLYALNADGTLHWKVDLLLVDVRSSPAVGPFGHVFVTSNHGKLHAFDAANGAVAWEGDLDLKQAIPA